MPAAGSIDLLHIAAFATGAVLYGMLLGLVARTPARLDSFALTTALLGLAWNIGELAAYAARGTGFPAAASWSSAAAYIALGALASVVVHSSAHGAARWPRLAAVVVYGGAFVAGACHVAAAAAGDPLPSATGLTWLTGALGAAVLLTALAPRHPSEPRRVPWLTALALFAVSVLHLGRFHGAQESWPIELLGHHASILLAFALLYQDFRFAFADLFLKRALTLLVLVAVVGGSYASLVTWLSFDDDTTSPAATAALLALWAGTALVFPALRRGVTRFVDRAVLHRHDYARFSSDLASAVQRLDGVEAVLDHACGVLAPALSASCVTWVERGRNDGAGGSIRTVPIETTEAPGYAFVVGPLQGGRRLLSDDVALLDRAALEVARRIDALRLTGERYERMLQEREIRSLVSEAELRALRAQINPHFLFNALTTVTYLIDRAPSRARAAVLRLTTLLRSALRSEGAFTTLGRERELLECYLQIEHERFEERLVYLIDIPDTLSDLPVPALLIQPLVENAIKHGVSGAAEGGMVAVSVGITSDLTVMVRNTGMPLGSGASSPGFGVGMQNVQRRLFHHYGSEATLTLRSGSDGATIAELRIPLSHVLEPEAGLASHEADR